MPSVTRVCEICGSTDTIHDAGDVSPVCAYCAVVGAREAMEQAAGDDFRQSVVLMIARMNRQIQRRLE
jgi:hypothetical protein